jgi:hypothetical protein
VIRRSGSNALNNVETIFSNPLKTDRIIISAIVPMVIPATEIPEIILMMLWDFFDIR